MKTSKVINVEDKPQLKIDQDRQKKTQDIVEAVFADARFVLNPVVRAKIRTLSVDAYWHFQPLTAQKILRDEVSALATWENLDGTANFVTEQEGKVSYKGKPLEEVKAQLKRELFATAGVNDPLFFRELVRSKRGGSDTDQLAEQIHTATHLAGSDPQASARLIRESLDKGIEGSFAFALVKLRESSPAEASALFNNALGRVRASGDLWQYQRLIPYVLPSERDRLIGAKHYLTDAQRMLDAKKAVEYGSELLYRRIQTEAPANMPPDLVKREYYLWRNLQTVFEDVNPSQVWLVNTRLRQLASTLPPTTQRPTDGPWSPDRLQTLLAAADQSTGEKRDNYLSSAAFATWRFGNGDLNKAIALVEKIGDSRVREDTAAVLYFQAGTKYLRTEGPDYALELARKINFPVSRAQLFLEVIALLQDVKDTARANELRRELLSWLSNSERNSDTAWALLDFLDATVSSVAEEKFAALELLVRVLNSPSLESTGGLKNRVYWHPEFHDFRKSLMPLVKADFDRTLNLIQMLDNREISLQVQAAFCANYFKLQSHNRNVSERR
ncbi:MAG TPA: hypothetical protein VFZ71_04030 [Pyrinomonadaceae bacterium]